MEKEVCTRALSWARSLWALRYDAWAYRYDVVFFVLGIALSRMAGRLEAGHFDVPGSELLANRLIDFVGVPLMAWIILWPVWLLIYGYHWLRRREWSTPTPAWWPVGVALFATAVHLLTELMQLRGGFVDRRPHPAGWQDEVINFIARHQGIQFDPVDVILVLLSGGLTLACLVMSRRTHIRAGNRPVW